MFSSIHTYVRPAVRVSQHANWFFTSAIAWKGGPRTQPKKRRKPASTLIRRIESEVPQHALERDLDRRKGSKGRDVPQQGLSKYSSSESYYPARSSNYGSGLSDAEFITNLKSHRDNRLDSGRSERSTQNQYNRPPPELKPSPPPKEPKEKKPLPPYAEPPPKYGSAKVVRMKGVKAKTRHGLHLQALHLSHEIKFKCTNCGESAYEGRAVLQDSDWNRLWCNPCFTYECKDKLLEAEFGRQVPKDSLIRGYKPRLPTSKEGSTQ